MYGISGATVDDRKIDQGKSSRSLYRESQQKHLSESDMALRRALHFVFKVGDRAKTATFYRDVLGMKVNLH